MTKYDRPGDLYLLLSKNDAFTYNGGIFKTRRVLDNKLDLFGQASLWGKTLRVVEGLDIALEVAMKAAGKGVVVGVEDFLRKRP